ncbi:MAG: DUF4013 domain-containing protein [Candidatus Aureabacteria bacterium]|nr:DUF4013 domain-containing protein [Candidatus Auribacterota bacterium]
MKVDLKKTLSFPFSDEKWIIKILIGGLLNPMIPVLNFFSIGYLMRILKNVVEGKEPSLPEWTDWENLFKEGAFGFLIILIYAVCVFTVFSIINMILSCIAIIIVPLETIFWCVVFPLWTYLSIIKYMQTNDLKAAFDFQGIFNIIKSNINDYSITALLVGLIIFLCSMLCCVLLPVFYGQLVAVVAFGSLYHLTVQPAKEEAEKPEGTAAE